MTWGLVADRQFKENNNSTHNKMRKQLEWDNHSSQLFGCTTHQWSGLKSTYNWMEKIIKSERVTLWQICYLGSWRYWLDLYQNENIVQYRSIYLIENMKVHDNQDHVVEKQCISQFKSVFVTHNLGTDKNHEKIYGNGGPRGPIWPHQQPVSNSCI